MLIAITYHYVREDFSGCSGGIHGVTPAELEQQLAGLSKQASFVDAADVLAAVKGNQALPARSMLVTFDDGLREQYECALPVLNRMGIPAMFFVNTRPIAEDRMCTVHKVHLSRATLSAEAFQSQLFTSASALGIDLTTASDPVKVRTQYPFDTEAAGNIKFLLNFGLPLASRIELVEATFANAFPGAEKALCRSLYMDRDQINRLSRSGMIGTHGHDHLPIGEVGEELARATIARSVDLLELWTRRRPFALSYPYGTRDTCSPATARIAEEHGIQMAFTVESAGNSPESLRAPQFLGRFDCNLLPGGKRPLWSNDELFENVPSSEWHRPAALKEVESGYSAFGIAANR